MPVLELVFHLALPLLLVVCRSVHLDKVASEDRVKPVSQQVILALTFQLSQTSGQFIFHLEIGLAHLVFEASGVDWLFDDSLVFLPTFFADYLLLPLSNPLFLQLRAFGVFSDNDPDVIVLSFCFSLLLHFFLGISVCLFGYLFIPLTFGAGL